MSKICKEYISEIKTLFPVKGKKEKAYIKKLQADVKTYCEEAGVTEKQELYNNYGKPFDIVNSYFSVSDTDYISQKIRTTYYFRAIIITTIILLTIIASLFCKLFYEQQQMLIRQDAFFESLIIEKPTE